MKCDQYWPSRGTETYGMVQVTLVDVVELATYTVRTFQLARVRYRRSTEFQPHRFDRKNLGSFANFLACFCQKKSLRF